MVKYLNLQECVRRICRNYKGGSKFLFPDQQSIDSMKSHMLLQLPGTKFLYLPPYNPELDLKSDTMDHLASICVS